MHKLVHLYAHTCIMIRWQLLLQLRGFIFGRFSKSICDIIKTRFPINSEKSVIERGVHQEILLRKCKHSHDHAGSFYALDREE
jgi:hypothetical protein